jgi:RND family efflux transporter MFP subunit
MNRAKPRLGLILFAVGSLLAGCSVGTRTLPRDNRPANVSSSANRSPLTVHVFNAEPSPNANRGDQLIPAALSVEGTAIVLAERGGRIVDLTGREGAHIKKGDVLARFNDEDQRTQLRQAEIEVSRLTVEEQQYEALVKLSRSELEREQGLAKAGVSSKVDVEQAQYKFEQADREYAKTKLASQSGRAKLRSSQIEIEKSTVRAPITGVIVHSYATLGSSVAQNDKLFEVSKLSPLEVKFRLPQNGKIKLREGEIVNLSAVNSDAIIARARVRRIDPVADATSNTFGYLADVVSGKGLMPGLAVNLHLPRDSDALSFWIPRAAFPAGTDLRRGASATLFVVEGIQADARIVQVSSIEGDQVEIVSGLSANDRVILSPPAQLEDRDPIEISSS